MSILASQLKRLGFRLAARHFLCLLSLHLCGLCAGLLLLECLIRIMPLRENTVAIAIIALIAASSASLARAIAKSLIGKFSPDAIAKRIESAHPRLMDSLNCALELEAKHDLNDIEKLLLCRIHTAWADSPQDFALPRKSPFRAFLALLAALTAFFALAAKTRAGAQFQFWLHDILQGYHSGIVVITPKPGDKVMKHNDMTVRAIVTRWSPDATVHYRNADNAIEAYPMHPDEANSHQSSFIFYNVTSAVQFKITTPELETPWMTVDSYSPPAFRNVKLTVHPQPYTRLPVQSFPDFQSVTAICGDTVSIECTVTDGSGVRLLNDNGLTRPFKQNGTAFTLDMTAEQSENVKVMVTDNDGKDVTAAQFPITVIPDLPPVIDRSDPLEDAKLTPADSLRLAVSASDDFEVTHFTLNYRIIGQHNGVIDLARGKAAKEIPFADFWDVHSFKLQPGDAISCVLVAKDNRLPVPNVTRTQPFFITIVPSSNDDQGDSDQQNQDQEQKVDLSDLIAESKRIIRATFDLQFLDNPPEQNLNQTQIELHDLAIEVARRKVTMQNAAQLPDLPPPFGPLFARCLGELDMADTSFGQRRLADSIEHQENALAALLKMESELLKNKHKGKGGGKQKEQQQTQQKEQSKPKVVERNNNTVRCLQDTIGKLQAIISRQDALNAAINRNDTPLEHVIPKQTDIRNDTNDVEQSLNNLDDAASARSCLQETKNEMNGCITACRNRQRQPAAIHAARAQRRLTDALNILETILQKAEANAVENLAGQTQRLADEQNQAAAQSATLQKQKKDGSITQKQHADARRNQDDLRKKTEQLRKNLNDTADTIQQNMPETARQLRDLEQELQRNATQDIQKKAANALLYKRFDKAEEAQKKAADDLGKLAGKLRDVAQNMPEFTLEELKKYLENLKKLAKQADDARQTPSTQLRQQQLNQLRQKLQQNAGELAKMLKEQRLEQLADNLNGKIGEQTLDADARKLLQDFRTAMDITAEHIIRLDRNRELQLNREVVSPPDKYRRLVQEYFKELGK